MKHNSKINYKKIISISLLVILLTLFIYYIFNHLEDFKSLSVVKPTYLIPLILLSIIASYANGLIIKFLVQPFDIKLKFKEWFGLSIITSFYNMITPFRGGLAAKAVYLKNKHNFSYPKFLSTIAGLYVINFLTAGIVGLISLYILYKKHSIFSPIILFIFLGFVLPLLFIILFSPKFKDTKYPLVNKFIEVLNGWTTLSKHKKIISYCSLIIALQILINSTGTYLSYHIFGVELDIWKALFLTSIGIISSLIQITPSGLGINEAIAIFSGLIIGITPPQALAVAILGRVVGIIVIFTLGPIYSYILLKHKTENLPEK
ncbi:MAG: lysylphosphatidylglycerol synthase transmembrane domain-containing protein [Candidatus Woesearchaeota archaeon]